MENFRAGKTQEPQLPLLDLMASGIKVTVCRPGKAKGSRTFGQKAKNSTRSSNPRF